MDISAKICIRDKGGLKKAVFFLESNFYSKFKINSLILQYDIIFTGFAGAAAAASDRI